MLSNLRTHTHTILHCKPFTQVRPDVSRFVLFAAAQRHATPQTARCLTPFGSTITATWILVHPAIQLEPAAEPTGTYRALVWQGVYLYLGYWGSTTPQGNRVQPSIISYNDMGTWGNFCLTYLLYIRLLFLVMYGIVWLCYIHYIPFINQQTYLLVVWNIFYFSIYWE